VNVEKFWRLDSPSMCRDFLKYVCIGLEGAKIEYLQQADGKRLSIDEATDEQVMELVQEIAEAIGRKPRGGK